MSASLVGSEMCIRDRLEGARAHAGSRSGELQSPLVRHVLTRAPQGMSRCLLYTSDAADDM
eukprot:10986685-Alexandrium_andersonii.AAC.1